MAKRYFEYKDAKSKKFWEVSVSGKKVNIRYGKLGTDGQTSVKELGTPAEAKAHAEKQAAGKVKKGYKEAKAKAVKKVVKKKTIKKKATKKKVAKKVTIMNGDKIIDLIVEELLPGYGSGCVAEDLIELFFYGEPTCRSFNLEEDEKNLIQFRVIEPRDGKWSIRLEEHFGSPTNEDDIWSGDYTTEEIFFCGDVVAFKVWIKKNRENLIKELDLCTDRIKKLDALIISFEDDIKKHKK